MALPIEEILPQVQAAGQRHDALGLVWIDSDAAMMPDGDGDVPPPENAVLRRLLDCLPPFIAPENVVLIGLRNAAPEEVEALKAQLADHWLKSGELYDSPEDVPGYDRKARRVESADGIDIANGTIVLTFRDIGGTEHTLALEPVRTGDTVTWLCSRSKAPKNARRITNIRAAGKDDALILTPPIELTLEYAVEFIADDELVEVTPKNIRIRKRLLLEHERKRASRVEEALLA